jgi:hypothetical protein
MLSKEDAEDILNMIKSVEVLANAKPEKYTGVDNEGKPVIEELTSGPIFDAIQNAHAAAAATYLSDDGLILADDDGMLTL